MPPQSARRQRQPRLPIEVRREQVLDAALSLIAANGYGAATMDAIAREADIAKPVVYNAYPGRGPLLHALLDREEQRGLRALAAAMPPQEPGRDPAETLIAWLSSMAGAITANPTTWRLILLPVDGTPPEVRQRVEAGRAFALRQANALAVALIAKGAPRAELDPDLVGHTLFAACEHIAGLLLQEPDTYPPERVIRYAETVVALLGLRGPSSYR